MRRCASRRVRSSSPSLACHASSGWRAAAAAAAGAAGGRRSTRPAPSTFGFSRRSAVAALAVCVRPPVAPLHSCGPGQLSTFGPPAAGCSHSLSQRIQAAAPSCRARPHTTPPLHQWLCQPAPSNLGPNVPESLANRRFTCEAGSLVFLSEQVRMRCTAHGNGEHLRPSLLPQPAPAGRARLVTQQS
jgi:hypothetical protein